ncbi:FAD-dependent oxidoreductase [Catalinimonas alkaloidigena]|uniref:FAD-dependent oxidoreductase n=1 Tax=Catalinimonas alkaloidigena TaxID=1075417 RepID=UPI0030B8A8D1
MTKNINISSTIIGFESSSFSFPSYKTIGNFNTITEAEEIRDHSLRAIYGNWSYLKNEKKDKYANYELAWVAYIGGKRESRRLLGDHILTQMDIQEGEVYPDATVTATWTIDLHFPDEENSRYLPGEEFLRLPNTSE